MLWPQEPRGLYTNLTLMPEYLNQLGYRSHMVGKWHLGHCSEDYHPTSRGFETYQGILTGSGYHYSHTRPATGEYVTYVLHQCQTQCLFNIIKETLGN